MGKHTTPAQWRVSAGLTQAALAERLGVVGKNPSRTIQRWETGENKAPASVIAAVEKLSRGRVRAAAWAQIREDYLNRRANKGVTCSLSEAVQASAP